MKELSWEQIVIFNELRIIITVLICCMCNTSFLMFSPVSPLQWSFHLITTFKFEAMASFTLSCAHWRRALFGEGRGRDVCLTTSHVVLLHPRTPTRKPTTFLLCLGRRASGAAANVPLLFSTVSESPRVCMLCWVVSEPLFSCWLDFSSSTSYFSNFWNTTMGRLSHSLAFFLLFREKNKKSSMCPCVWGKMEEGRTTAFVWVFESDAADDDAYDDDDGMDSRYVFPRKKENLFLIPFFCVRQCFFTVVQLKRRQRLKDQEEDDENLE